MATMTALLIRHAHFAVVFYTLGLAFGMFLLMELGRRAGARLQAKDIEQAREGIGAVDGAVFGLLGLLLAFSFSGAASRLDTRRNLITQEANAIGTAWLRLDLLPAEAQPELRALFREYLDSRLEAYRRLLETDVARTQLVRSMKLQSEIWTRAVASCSTEAGQRAAILLLPALNEMFDITTTRLMMLRVHPPSIIFVMLSLLMLASSLLAGLGMAPGRRRSWIHILCFTFILSLAFYVIIDLEFPRMGLIRVDAADRVLVDVRQNMD
jgi:hypothetical protein